MPVATEPEPPLPNGVAHPMKSVGGKHVSPTPKLDPDPGDHEYLNGNANGQGDDNSHNHGHSGHALDIIDIRAAAVEVNLKAEILDMFHPKQGPRHLPTLLLYDERGLQLFEEITYLEEYYLTNDEIAVLERSSVEIAKQIPDGSMVIELGSGNLRKVNLLLRALDEAAKSVDYYALDLSDQELKRTLAQLPQYSSVRCHGLLGTYDDGRDWLKEPANLSRQKCILTLGSSIGNFDRHDASDFLRGFADVLCPGDCMLVGLDSCYDPGKVFHAYNDREGVTHQFILNGLVNANKILGEEAFKVDDWRVIGEYVYDSEGGRHQAFYSPNHDTVAMGQLIPAHERVQIEQSLKYTKAEADKLWQTAGMVEADKWELGDEYGLHLLAKPTMPFSLIPSQYARSALPSLGDWAELWAVWDAVTRGMLPKKELLEKPIKLRNACIFYLGHIPTFLDIQLTKTTKTSPTEPRFYYSIFERGIDPDVDNPELCHAHSEIPEEWPPEGEIGEYQSKVRARLQSIYAAGVNKIPRDVGRAIWASFEHEVMHLETLLYMLLQSDKTLPPPGTSTPDFKDLASKARLSRVRNEWFDIPAREISVGIDDPESKTDRDGHFGWDNEKPPRRVHVSSFQAQARPITNEEYARYMYENHIDKMPASWAAADSTHAIGAGASSANGVANGATSNCGAANGHGNGHANGHSNGQTNGYTNSHTNGHNAEDDHEPLPASFLHCKAVRTVYGLVPLKCALDWPVFASYDELAGCALWMGGRIPTFEEARSIYEHAEQLGKRDEVEKRKVSRTSPAVNGHLSNDGVEETPPSRGSVSVENRPPQSGRTEQGDDELFLDLTGSNVGCQHWHPMAVTANGGRLAGQAQMGGVWEWTSSPLRRHEGFEPMGLYPNYTADFFDEKHNIVLGGSWATHPRIAGRKSFINWYQRNYPYAWVGARLVRDVVQ